MTSPFLDDLRQSLGAGYTIDRELGGGGMARVFVATDAALGRMVVVKVLPTELAADVSLERFRREIALAARLQHPHIVPLLASGDANGLPYFTMPFVEGESLRQRLANQGELPISEGVRILREVAAALAAAHQKGIVHRDIKPDNILLSGGSAMVTDFGVAKALDDAAIDPGSRADLTEVGVTLGTPAYMAPEQAAASPGIDARADIYAFGIMAYEMFAGRTPFAGRSAQATLAAQVVETPESIQKLRSTLPPLIAVLIMSCLEKRPADRPQTAAEVVRALDAVGDTNSAATPAALPLRARSSASRRALVTAAIVASVGSVVGVGYALAHRDSAVSGSPANAAEPTLAVMPLANADTAIDYLSYGIADEVRSQLTTNVRGLRVVSASSSNSFRGRAANAREIGRQLHVAYVVLGEMRRQPGGLHVTAELVNVDDNSSRSLGVFNRPQSDVSSLPDSIARAITIAFKITQHGDGGAATANAGTADPEAYNLYLRARFLIDKRGAPALIKGADLAQQAIARDPKFARAYAELGIARGLLPSYATGLNHDSAVRLALHDENTALALDSTLARAWAAHGFWTQNSHDWAGAERDIRKALALDPKLAMGHKWLCQVLIARGRSEDAVDECRTVTEIEPTLAVSWETYGTVLAEAGKDSLALLAAARAIEMDPSSAWSHRNRALVFIRRGQADAALREVDAVTQPIRPDLGTRGYVLAVLGKRDSAIAVARQLEPFDAADPTTTPALGLIHLGLGDTNRAIDYFIRSANAHTLYLVGSLISPQMDPLRSNARYPELLKALNLQDEPVAKIPAKRLEPRS